MHVMSAFEAFVNYNWPGVVKLYTSPWCWLDGKPCMMVIADGIGVMVVISKQYELADSVSDELLLEEIDYLIKAEDWVVYGETWDEHIGAVIYDPTNGASYPVQEMVEEVLAAKETEEEEAETTDKQPNFTFEEDAYRQDLLDEQLAAYKEAWSNA